MMIALKNIIDRRQPPRKAATARAVNQTATARRSAGVWWSHATRNAGSTSMIAGSIGGNEFVHAGTQALARASSAAFAVRAMIGRWFARLLLRGRRGEIDAVHHRHPQVDERQCRIPARWRLQRLRHHPVTSVTSHPVRRSRLPISLAFTSSSSATSRRPVIVASVASVGLTSAPPALSLQG